MHIFIASQNVNDQQAIKAASVPTEKYTYTDNR